MTTTPHERADTPRLNRLAWWTFTGGCALVLVIAAFLEPDVRGHGTHVQLGLPPCGFLSLTGAPCPGCGLTTAFAHAIRGDFALAASANPFGLLLFFVVCASVPLGVFAGARRWPMSRVLARPAIGRLGLVVAVSGVLVWAARVVEVL